MKKILIGFVLFFVGFGIVGAENINMNLVYKEAIVSRGYIRHNFNNGEQILKKIELYLNNIRKYKDFSKLETLNNKTKDLLINFRKKENLSKTEQKAFDLIKNLYFRSYIELNR